MISMISLHTVDPMLYCFPFLGVLSLELPQTAGRSRSDHGLFAILWLTWSISGCSHFFSSSGSTSLLAFPDFNWGRCFWIWSMVVTSWLMGKLFEIFCKWWTNSVRLPLSSLGATESIWLVGLKCFLELSKIFSEGFFFGAGFKADSWFLTREKSLSSSLLIADWLILPALNYSALNYSFFKNVARSLIVFRIFNNSLEKFADLLNRTVLLICHHAMAGSIVFFLALVLFLQ